MTASLMGSITGSMSASKSLANGVIRNFPDHIYSNAEKALTMMSDLLG